MRNALSVGLALGVATLLASYPIVSNAQNRFPARPMMLVIPSTPGGLTDIVGRATAPVLSRTLNQTVIPVNRPGAGGSVGAASVAKGNADGHTLLVGITSMVTLPAQALLNNTPPPFRVEELIPVASISTEPMMLVTRPEASYRTLKDVIEDARKRPATLTYSTTGVYGTYHVAIEMIAHAADIKLHAVHYKGGGGAMQGLLSKEVSLSLITRSVGLPHIQNGQLRPIVAWSQKRWEQLPEVPSLADAGINSGYDLVTGLFAPSETPVTVMKVLRDAARTMVIDPQFKAIMEKLAASITYADGPEFDKLWKSESLRLGKVVERIGRIE